MDENTSPITRTTPQGHPAPFEGPGYEESDVSIRGVVAFAIGLVVAAVVIHVVLGIWMGVYSSRARVILRSRPARFADERGQFPPPELQKNPTNDMDRLRDEDAKALSGYGWIDEKAGRARIPIDRAIDILARKGLPHRKEQAKAN